MSHSEFIKIGRRAIGNNYPVFVIAEAGVNHNGRLSLAKKLIDAAKDAGADAVKFQTFKTECLVTAQAPKAAYQKRQTGGDAQATMLKALELSIEDFYELQRYCVKKNILFLSTPFDFESAKFLKQLNVPAYKISSGDLTNIPLLQQIASYRKPIILSTGMANLAEIQEAVRAIYKSGNKNVVLLHCTSNYPAAFPEINLRAMLTMRDKFKVPVGYSDHTLGTEVAVAAVALGACVIEKHLTLDTKMSGPDHAASLSPVEFTQMVKAIRNIEVALGNGSKMPFPSEMEVAKIARKSVVAALPIRKGQRLTEDLLTIKRPGTGIPPSFLMEILGRKLNKDVECDHVLQWSEVSK